MKQNRHVKAFRYGMDKFPKWMAFYVDNARFMIVEDGSYHWAELHSSTGRQVVQQGDWIVERHYRLYKYSHEAYTEAFLN